MRGLDPVAVAFAALAVATFVAAPAVAAVVLTVHRIRSARRRRR